MRLLQLKAIMEHQGLGSGESLEEVLSKFDKDDDGRVSVASVRQYLLDVCRDVDEHTASKTLDSLTEFAQSPERASVKPNKQGRGRGGRRGRGRGRRGGRGGR